MLVLFENMTKSIDSKGAACALLTDLSKAFDCLKYDLLIAKLHGFSHSSLQLVFDYLSNRKQRVKIDATFSEWTEVNTGVPQGSIIGPLLFNIFINDIFYFVKDTKIINFDDANTPYICGTDIDNILGKLENEGNILIKWFSNNYMKVNADKCHLLVTNNAENYSINLGGIKIDNSSEEKLLGILVDNQLKFDRHINNLCKKASNKLHTLIRISHFMSKDKLRLFMQAFINSQFGYCPLIWMFHSRQLNNRINRIHKRALQTVYNDKTSTFEELLTKDNSVLIHHKHLQCLAIEIYKWLHKLSPKIMNNLFQNNSNVYSLRNSRCLKTENVRTVYYGTETVRFRAWKTWDLAPKEIQQSRNLLEFKRRIKSWVPSGCTCNICKTYIAGVGYM